MTRLFEAKPYIIAEIGSNWRTLDDCVESIKVAKDCGADAVKFQAFSSEALFGPGILVNTHGGLPVEEIGDFSAIAAAQGVEFGCTAFSPELVKAVDPYVHWHKVASSDAAWPQLLEAVGACKKPVLLSTGAKTDQEVLKASHMLAPKVALVRLICVAAYPADYVCLDPLISGVTGLGLSDHTLGYSVAVEAATCGAVVIEKHFTAFPDLDTPDRPHSLTPTQFKRMVDIIRGRDVESEETAMYLRHNRRLIATRDVAAGETLTYGENFGAYRSLEDDHYGASPFDWEKVQCKKAKASITRGKGIALEDVE